MYLLNCISGEMGLCRRYLDSFGHCNRLVGIIITFHSQSARWIRFNCRRFYGGFGDGRCGGGMVNDYGGR